MHSKNRAGAFFALLIILLVAFIMYWGSTKPVSVVIQAGHEDRISGNTGATGSRYKETEWNTLVADEVTKRLRSWDIDVKRIPAKVPFLRAKIAVSIHFDSAKRVCHSGASIGYPDKDSYDFARDWEKLYKAYYPFKWHQDNFTENLKHYYAYRKIDAEKFLVLELGEITCDEQTKWLKPRLKKIAHLIAYAIATERGKNGPKPAL
jgi:N-acetylmuramoyl-L-alanine amidase